MTTYNQTVSITTTSTVARQKTIAAPGFSQNLVIAQPVNLAQLQWHVALAQALFMHERPPTYIKTIALSLTQNMTCHFALANQWVWCRTILQNVTIHLIQSQHMTYTAALTQAVKLLMIIIRATPATLTQAMTVHHATTVATVLHLLQKFNIHPSHIPQVTFHTTLLQNLIMNSALTRYLAEILTQAMSVHPTQALQAIFLRLLTQNMTAHMSQTLALGITLEEDLELEDANILQMLYNGQLADGLVMTGIYVNGAGETTTWAINTRTNAITQYTNYNYNSFASRGLTYLATSPNGIYELDGDTDAGLKIVAEAQSGLARMNGTKLTGIKGAYMAVRGGGRFYIKLVSGDGRNWVYEAIAQPGLMTTKINVGKGLRTSYLAFNLMSEGQDFDLDTLEFIPMVSDRRV